MTPSVENTRKNPSADPITIVGMASSEKYREYYSEALRSFFAILPAPDGTGARPCLVQVGY